jgi:hypothetical protein
MVVFALATVVVAHGSANVDGGAAARAARFKQAVAAWTSNRAPGG